MEESAYDKLKKFLKHHGYQDEEDFEDYMAHEYFNEAPEEGSNEYIFQKQIERFFYEMLIEDVEGMLIFANLLGYIKLSTEEINDILQKVSNILLPTLEYGYAFFVIDPNTGRFRFASDSAGLLVKMLNERRMEVLRREGIEQEGDSEKVRKRKRELRRVYIQAGGLLKTLNMLIRPQLIASYQEKYAKQNLEFNRLYRDYYHAMQTGEDWQ